MKSMYQSDPCLMKMSPASDVNPSRPYVVYNYISTLSVVNAVKEINAKVKIRVPEILSNAFNTLKK